MAIKKDAAKATIKGPKKIPTKETVDTPISECEAENPMECKYHGLQAFNNYISSVTKNLGFNGSFEADKLQGNKGFQIKMPGFYSLANGFSDGIVNAAKNAGFDASYEGKDDDGKHLFLFKKDLPKKPKKKKKGSSSAEKTPDGGDAVESAEDAPKGSIISQVDNLYKEISHYVQSNMEDIQSYSDKDSEWKDAYEKIWQDISTHFAYDNLDGLKKSFDEIKEHIEKGKELIGNNPEGVGDLLDDGSLDDFLLGEEEDAKDAKTTIKDDAETDAWIEEQTKKEKELSSGIDDGLDDVDEFLGGEEVEPIDNDELDDFLDSEGVEEEEKSGFTTEEIKDFLAKNGLTEETKHGKTPFDEVVANWKGLIEEGQAPNGAKLEEQYVSFLKGFYDAAGPDNEVAKALWDKMVEKGIVEGTITEPSEKEWVEALEIASVIGYMFGKTNGMKTLKTAEFYWDSGEHEHLSDINQEKYKEAIKKIAEAKGKNAPVVQAMISAYKSHPQYEMTGVGDFNGMSGDGSVKEALLDKLDETLQKDVDSTEPSGKDWEEAYDIIKEDTEWTPVSESYIKEILQTSLWQNLHHEDELLASHNQYHYKDWIKKIAKVKGKDSPVVKAMVAAFKSHPEYDMSGLDEFGDAAPTPTKVKEKKEDFEVEEKEIQTESYAMPSEGVLKPLEHDESKFPQEVSQKELETAIANGKKAGGHGGLGTTIVEIGGKKYVCKNGSGKKSKIIRNGYMADMAYRAGGVHAPDAKLYEFEDGSTYKLSEFIDGTKLIDVWKSADENRRNEIRKELLKGYPLDVLFSNYDVLGTSPEESQTVTITGMDGKPQKTHVAFDNVIVGNDGQVYRIDNDGAFAMTGTGGVKTSDSGSFTTKVDYEHWEDWAERQWIDDFRTLRVNEKNAGIFDRYSTADIFISASRVNYDAMEVALDANPKLKQALLKPLFEMKQMAFYAHGAEVAGYKNQRGMSWKGSDGKGFTIECDPISMALDAIYNGHKAGIRKFLQKKISWMDTGWLSGSSGSSQAYVPKSFQKPEPQEPKPPTMGLDMAKEVLEGVKTIAYHVKKGDFNPNENRIKKALAAKPFVEVLAKTGDPKAKGILEAIGKIEESIETGHKKALHFDTPDGFFDVEGLSLVVDAENSAIYSKHIAPIHQKWENEYKKWLAEKKEWDEREIEKAKKAGAAPTKNFQGYEDMLVTANINTNGIHQGGGTPSVNHDSKTAQKGTSFSKKACLKKVRQYAMMGLSLDEMDFSNGDKTFYNGNTENGGHHVSGGDGVENYKWAVQYYRDNPEEFKKAMQAYAVHKGMLVLCHANMDNPAIDHSLLTCFVMRGEHKQAWGKDGKGAPTEEGIIKSYPIDSSASACINATGHFGSKKIGWKLPIWRITDNFMIGAGSEEEICINPIKIPYPPMYFPDTSDGWLACMEKYNQQKEVKAIDKKLGKAEDK